MTEFASFENAPHQTLEKTTNGFLWSLNDGIMLFEMYFDKEGVYTHQIQDDMIDYGVLRIVASGVKPLTKKQMNSCG